MILCAFRHWQNKKAVFFNTKKWKKRNRKIHFHFLVLRPLICAGAAQNSRYRSLLKFFDIHMHLIESSRFVWLPLPGQPVLTHSRRGCSIQEEGGTLLLSVLINRVHIHLMCDFDHLWKWFSSMQSLIKALGFLIIGLNIPTLILGCMPCIQLR